MRPTRLELSGFTAFREPVVIDFTDTELFALAGPTGSGKSSVIDAMCFALYGSVPRLDRKSVAPVITAGRVEAKIRFDFLVEDQPHTAVRIVRRTTAGGATTKEARLERGEEVLASGADDVTVAVEKLFGLGFGQFTKCIVLPQGEFARFLHDRPKDRQDLLVRLLGLDVYARMKELANAQSKRASTAAELIGAQLASLADATPAACTAAQQRVTDLTALVTQLDAADAQLAQLVADRRQAAEAQRTAQAWVAQLRAVTIPDGVAQLSRDAADAQAAAATAQQTWTAAEAAVAAAQSQRGALPDGAAALAQAKAHHAERAGLLPRCQRGGEVVAASAQAQREAEQALDVAQRRVEAAEAAMEALRRAHSAHDLAGQLVAGAACPVCRQDVAQIPALEAPQDLARGVAARDAAVAQRTAAEGALRAAAQAAARHAEHLANLHARIAELDAALTGQPGAAEVDRLLDATAAADAALAGARDTERSARDAARAAQAVAQAAIARRDGCWTRHAQVRDPLIPLGPPAADRDDVLGSWRQLAGWAAQAWAAQDAAAGVAAATVAASDAELARRRAELDAVCAAAGVVTGGGADPDRARRDAAADALASARAAQQRMADRLAQAQQLLTEQAEHTQQAAVASTLGRHLAANGFERWLLDEALTDLAVVASATLRELSAGQYSLEVDGQRNFGVIDHRNADERRPARTLSGGETFLASLALALALSARLAAHAPADTARLDAIFLDEGFGTLDPETLDAVAAAIEELGASGRTVGIVTHVRELAHRLPVRYEVRRGPSGASVERVVM